MQVREQSLTPADAVWLDSYLDLLGLERQPPSLGYLRALARAHLLRVPFENFTSILRRARTPVPAPVPPLDLGSKLADWHERRGGGVCFEVTDMLTALLGGLGFNAHAVLATISFPGSHQSVVVDFGAEASGRYLVDVGNGAPFFEPILLSTGEPTILSQSGLAYRFRTEGSAALVQERLIEGSWQPFCTYQLDPATDADRAAAYQRHHVRGGSWVVDSPRTIRCTESDVWVLSDGRTLTHFDAQGAKSVVSVDSVDELRRVVAEVFALPDAPVEAALRALN